MKIEDFIKKPSADQFIFKEMHNNNGSEFAVTNCSIDENFKHINIEFSNGQSRFMPVDFILLALIEFYGKEYLVDLISKVNPYDSIKHKSLLNGGDKAI